MKNLNNKLVQRIIISLQILYILLYFATSSINNIYFTFWLSAIISILSLILSMMNIINKGNFKLLFILISITQILLLCLSTYFQRQVFLLQLNYSNCSKF